MYRRFPMLPFYESVGAIPSSYLVSLSYEEQILWLCSQIQAIKEGTPNYNYELLENKPKIAGIELIGDKPLSVFGIQPKLTAGDGIEITNNVISATGSGGGSSNTSLLYEYKDTIVSGSYYDLNVALGSEVSLTPIVEANTSRAFIEGVKVNDRFRIEGNYEAGIIYPQGNILLHKEEGVESFYCLTDGDLVISWFNTNEYTPKLYRYYTGNDIVERLEDDEQDIFDLNEKIGRVMTDQIILNADGTMDIGIHTGGGLATGWYLLEAPVFLHSAISENTLYNNEAVFYDSTNKVFYGSILQVKYSELSEDWAIDRVEAVEQTLTNNQSKVPSSHAVYQAIQNISPSVSSFYGEIPGDLCLNADGTTTPQLVEGYYYLKSGHYLDYYDQDGILQTDYDFTNGILYFNGSSQVKLTGVNTKNGIIDRHYSYLAFETPLNSFWQQTSLGDSTVVKNLTGTVSTVHTSIPSTGNNNDVPTISAVRNYVSTLTGTFYTVIDQDITLNADGSSSPTLTSGNYYYLTPTHRVYYYDDSNTLTSTNDFTDSIFSYEDSASTKSLNRTGLNTDTDDIGKAVLSWQNTWNYWSYMYADHKFYVQNTHTINNVFTRDSIPATGHDYDIPTVDAIRNYLTPTDISSQFSYTAQAGITIASFKAIKMGATTKIFIKATFSAVTSKDIPILTFSNLSTTQLVDGTGYGYGVYSPSYNYCFVAPKLYFDTGVVHIFKGTEQIDTAFIVFDLPTLNFSS